MLMFCTHGQIFVFAHLNISADPQNLKNKGATNPTSQLRAVATALMAFLGLKYSRINSRPCMCHTKTQRTDKFLLERLKYIYFPICRIWPYCSQNSYWKNLYHLLCCDWNPAVPPLSLQHWSDFRHQLKVDLLETM